MVLFERYFAGFLDSFWVTCVIALVSVALALILACLLTGALLCRSQFVAKSAVAYVEVMRNTPLVTQLFFIYAGLPTIGIFLPAFYCGVVAIALQHAAFFAEIFRAGIQSISSRQFEAATALGMRSRTAFRVVVLPQALQHCLPAIGNQFAVLVKDTSVASGIGILELTLRGKIIIERTAASYEVYLIIAAMYLLLNTLIGLAVRLLEKRSAKWT